MESFADHPVPEGADGEDGGIPKSVDTHQLLVEGGVQPEVMGLPMKRWRANMGKHLVEEQLGLWEESERSTGCISQNVGQDSQWAREGTSSVSLLRVGRESAFSRVWERFERQPAKRSRRVWSPIVGFRSQKDSSETKQSSEPCRT